MTQLFVAFTSDTEDNHPSYVPGWQYVGSNYDVRPCRLRWEWTRFLRDLSDLFNDRGVPVTWLIRVDDGPMRHHMLDLLRDEILGLKSKGDEIGIHIHTFAWNSEFSKWVQTKDPRHEARIVRHSINIFRRKLGFAPLSVRMGWYTMSNEIMRTLDANGLEVDSSAIPGGFSSGKFDRRDNIYDWARAPRFPYHPSYDDYQSPGNLKILEIPISTLETNKSNTFADLVNKLSRVKSLSKMLPIARRLSLNPHRNFYISPWWGSSIYSKIIKAYGEKARANEDAFLVASFHACDILDPRTENKNCVFKHYLSNVIEEILSLKGIEVKFETLSGMAEQYCKD